MKTTSKPRQVNELAVPDRLFDSSEIILDPQHAVEDAAIVREENLSVVPTAVANEIALRNASGSSEIRRRPIEDGQQQEFSTPTTPVEVEATTSSIDGLITTEVFYHQIEAENSSIFVTDRRINSPDLAAIIEGSLTETLPTTETSGTAQIDDRKNAFSTTMTANSGRNELLHSTPGQNNSSGIATENTRIIDQLSIQELQAVNFESSSEPSQADGIKNEKHNNESEFSATELNDTSHSPSPSIEINTTNSQFKGIKSLLKTTTVAWTDNLLQTNSSSTTTQNDSNNTSQLTLLSVEQIIDATPIVSAVDDEKSSGSSSMEEEETAIKSSENDTSTTLSVQSATLASNTLDVASAAQLKNKLKSEIQAENIDGDVFEDSRGEFTRFSEKPTLRLVTNKQRFGEDNAKFMTISPTQDKLGVLKAGDLLPLPSKNGQKAIETEPSDKNVQQSNRSVTSLATAMSNNVDFKRPKIRPLALPKETVTVDPT